jgi:hypothetical protein
MRLVWDAVLIIVNAVMAGLKKMPLQTFFFNIFVLLLVDGYLNMVIYSYLKKKLIVSEDEENRLSTLENDKIP